MPELSRAEALARDSAEMARLVALYQKEQAGKSRMKIITKLYTEKKTKWKK